MRARKEEDNWICHIASMENVVVHVLLTVLIAIYHVIDCQGVQDTACCLLQRMFIAYDIWTHVSTAY